MCWTAFNSIENLKKILILIVNKAPQLNQFKSSNMIEIPQSTLNNTISNYGPREIEIWAEREISHLQVYNSTHTFISVRFSHR